MPMKPPVHGRKPRGKRPSAWQRGYDAEWSVARAAQLERKPWCKCGQKATVVDHKTPMSQGGAKTDPRNLQSLCKACHDRKTATQDGAFGNGRGAAGATAGQG